jgi:hypothetical protein
MIIKLFFTTVLVSLISNSLAAQEENIYLPDPGRVKIIVNGKEKKLAWAGGMNKPQFASVDLNQDGLSDILVFERGDGKRVKTFINNGTKGNPDYRYAPLYEANIPNISHYMLIQNFHPECDDIPDLLNYGESGMGYCEGYYNSNGQLSFKKSSEIYYMNSQEYPTNPNVGSASLPAVVDVDNDGDMDILAYDGGSGGRINFYRNYTKEKGIPCSQYRLKWWDKCWGKFFNYESERTRTLNFSCVDENNFIRKKTTDAVHNLTLIDIDGDDDYDVLEARNGAWDLQLVLNGKIQYGSTEDSMMSQDTLWQTGGKQVTNYKFPAAFYADADGDGIKDIIVSPQSQSENCKVASVYRNTGTVKNPSFVYQQDDFLAEDMLDIGERSFPAFFDYNKDGKPDLFLCSRGMTDNNGNLVPRLYYFKNTTVNSNVSFTLEDDDFLQIRKLNMAPTGMAFGDINQDGKDDFILGLLSGELMFYNNVAPRANIQPAFTTPVKLTDKANNIISVFGEAAPAIYDVNKDGKKDLVIGNVGGTLIYYRNVSIAPNVVELEYITDSLGKVSVFSKNLGGSSYPYLGKLNGTNDEYLLVGRFDNADIEGQKAFSTVTRYKLTGNDDANAIYQLLDTSYSKIRSHGYYSAPAVTDIDGDGMLDMVVGNDMGGFYFFRQAWDLNVTNAEKALEQLSIYPNPAIDKLVISFNNIPVDRKTIVRIFNTTGQMLMMEELSQGTSIHSLDISGLPTGVYQCNIISGSANKSSTFVKQ